MGTGGNGNGGKQTTAGCYLSVKSERPWGNDVFAAKDALAEIARTAGGLGPRDKFNGYLVKDSADPTIYSIKFPDPEMTRCNSLMGESGLLSHWELTRQPPIPEEENSMVLVKLPKRR